MFANVGGSFLFRMVLSAGLAALVGCAGSRVTPLEADVKSKITSSRAMIVVPQEEIGAEIKPSNLARATGGALFALVDAGVESRRAEKARQALEPLRHGLAGFDARGEFRSVIGSALADTPWLKLGDVELTGRRLTEDELDKTRAAIREDMLVVVIMNYLLAPNLNQLKMTMAVQVWPQGKDRLVFEGKYRYISAPVGKEKGEKAIAKWSSDDGSRIKAALREGLGELGRMARMDLATQGQPVQETKPSDGDANVVVGFDGIYRGMWRSPAQININVAKFGDVAAHVLERKPDRIIYRDRDGIVYSGFVFDSRLPDYYRPNAGAISRVSGDRR